MVKAGVGYRAAAGRDDPDDADAVLYAPGAPVTWKGVTIASFGAAAGVTVYYRIVFRRGAVDMTVKRGWYADWGDPHGVLFSLPATNAGDVLVVMTTDEAGDSATPAQILALYDPDPPSPSTPVIETALPGRYDDEPPWIHRTRELLRTSGAAGLAMSVTIPTDETWEVTMTATATATATASNVSVESPDASAAAIRVATHSSSADAGHTWDAGSGPLVVQAGTILTITMPSVALNETVRTLLSYRYRWWGVT